MDENNIKTIGIHHGWEIKKVTNSKGTYYMAYFDLGSNKMPLMLSDYNLDNLKKQLDTVYVLHGKIIRNIYCNSKNRGSK